MTPERGCWLTWLLAAAPAPLLSDLTGGGGARSPSTVSGSAKAAGRAKRTAAAMATSVIRSHDDLKGMLSTESFFKDRVESSSSSHFVRCLIVFDVNASRPTATLIFRYTYYFSYRRRETCFHRAIKPLHISLSPISFWWGWRGTATFQCFILLPSMTGKQVLCLLLLILQLKKNCKKGKNIQPDN